jgi:hypothetical protein
MVVSAVQPPQPGQRLGKGLFQLFPSLGVTIAATAFQTGKIQNLSLLQPGKKPLFPVGFAKMKHKAFHLSKISILSDIGL